MFTASNLRCVLSFLGNVLVALLLVSRSVDGLECYSCTRVASVASCNTVRACPDGSFCRSRYITSGTTRLYTLGCMSPSSCSAQSSIVGRAAGSDTCDECCHTGMCNRQLCQHDYPGCVDTTDCSLLGASTNVCFDTQHVKNVCRRFCGLCTLADGAWSAWTTWSACDVTCQNGTKTRSRACDNPAPVNGGATCDGPSSEPTQCATGVGCPVAGGWSGWTAWDPCSMTCDVGLQRRLRSCSNPAPTNGGPQCQGYTIDTRLCFPGACAVAGGWSDWAAWEVCSVSCDVGLQRRLRSCSNPAPVNGGPQCQGYTIDTRLCFPGACADGQWSEYGNWGGCTLTCGGGIISRYRSCTNPPPSLTGKYCVGNPVQSGSCQTQPCVDSVAFMAHGIQNPLAFKDEHLIYTTSLMNLGGGYDVSAGVFTAPVGGTYQFTAQICTEDRWWITVAIKVNGGTIATVANGDQQINGTCTSGSGLKKMSLGDKAWVDFETGHRGSFVNDAYRWNAFSGPVQSVAFIAHGNANLFLWNDTHIEYATILMNLGGGYDASTGVFTAPVGGTYQFTAQICIHDHQWLIVSIKVNGGVITTVSNGDQHINGTCTSGSGLKRMNVGDKAWVDFESGSQQGVVTDAFKWNAFSGVLITR